MAAANSYVQDGTGTYIPATQRPDGTWRKARRVKDGYIPQDEMPLYESKGKQWAKNRPTLPIGLNPVDALPLNSQNSIRKIPGLSEADSLASVIKASKKKKKKKKSDKKTELSDDIEKLTISSKPLGNVTSNKTEKKSQPIATDPLKRIRNLKKKLRDINTLKQKIESGELVNPEKDQLEKIKRQEEIEAEIEELELELESI